VAESKSPKLSVIGVGKPVSKHPPHNTTVCGSAIIFVVFPFDIPSQQRNPRAALRSTQGYLILPRWGNGFVQVRSPMQTSTIYQFHIAVTKHGRCSVARNKWRPRPRAALRSALGYLILPRWGNGRSTCVEYCRTDSRGARVCLRLELLRSLRVVVVSVIANEVVRVLDQRLKKSDLWESPSSGSDRWVIATAYMAPSKSVSLTLVVLNCPRVGSSLGIERTLRSLFNQGYRPVIYLRPSRRHSVLPIDHHPGEVLRSALNGTGTVLALMVRS